MINTFIMSRSIFYITFFLLCIINCDAQKYDYNWILGGPHVEEVQLKKILLTFSDTSLHISQIDAFGSAVNSYIVSASDEEGKLIFYCNGLRFYTTDHFRMPGGDSLGYDINPKRWNTFNKIGYMGGAGNAGQFIPFPGHSGQYLVILPYTNDRDYSNPNLPIGTDLTYARIDMNLNNGKGRVIEKNELILDSVIDGYGLVQHANGRDWWLVMPVFMTNGFHTFLITQEGILGPVKQITGPEFKTGPIIANDYDDDPERGSQICRFSPDGKTLIRNHYLSGLYIYDFDRCTGEINYNRKTLTPKIGGFAFSPNSRYLYYTRVQTFVPTFQHDLYSQDTTNTYVLIGKPGGGGVLSPDGRLFSEKNSYIRTIEKPDLPGPACDIKQESYILPGRIGGFPVFPNYRLGPLPDADCDGMNSLYTPYGEPQYYSVEGRTYTHSKRYQLVKDDSWLIFYH